MSATLSSPSSTRPSVPVAAASVATDHQLPPVVHAIGGSIGSALAILAFYPLERVRVELQSRVGDKGSVSVSSEETGECVDNNQNTIDKATSCTIDAFNDEKQNETQREDVATINVMGHFQTQVKHEESSCSTPDSFELLVSPLKSADKEPFDTLSFEGADDTEEIPYIGLVRQAHELSPQKSTSSNSTSTAHDRDSEPSRSKHNQDIKNPPPPHETIIHCLLRLHNERTLYKGASPMVTTLMISNAIFFYALQVIRRSLASIQHNNRHQQQHKGSHHFIHMLTYYLYRALPKSKMGISLVASSLAGAFNVLLSNPLWVASLRIMESKVPVEDDKPEQQQNLWNVMQRIARNEGISHLWNGTCTSLLLVSNPIIQHFLYEQLRLWLLESRRKRSGFRRNLRGGDNRHGREGNILSLKASALSPVEALVFGALAKTVATVVTYPLQLAQVLLRLQRKQSQLTPKSNFDKKQNDSPKMVAYEGTLDCLYQQFSRGGIPALFQGMNAKLLQTVLTAAFTFLTYEQTLVHVGRIYEALGSKR